jgi:hypothetical protein
MPSKYLHGAFVQFNDSFPLPSPTVIVFQFNPETMTHSWQPAKSASGTPGHPSNPLAVTGTPQESFSFTLAMDANDMIELGGASEQLAQQSGVHSRLAALEMLLQPTPSVSAGLVGTISVSAGAGGVKLSAGIQAGPTRPVPAAALPMVLFVWGPNRIVPVRLSQLAITEKLYDAALLNPTHAEAQVQLQVLTSEELQFVTGPLGAIGSAAQAYASQLRHNFAGKNRDSGTQAVIGMLPL